MDNNNSTTQFPAVTMSSSTEKPLYLYPVPVAIDVLDLLICFLCVVLNASVIWVTAISRKIRKNRCCILLAVLSAAHVGAKIGTVVPKLVAWTVVTVPLFPNCILYVTLGIISGTTATFMTLMVAVDRLIGALFPVWYQRRKSSTYFALIALICSLPSIYKLTLTYIYAVQPANAQTQVVCLAGNAQTPQSAIFNYFYGITAVGTSVIAYLLVAIALKWHYKKSPNSPFVKSTNKIFRSLMTIMCLNTFGWLFGFSFITITYLLLPNLSPMTKTIIERSHAVLMDTNSSMDAIVLYTTSTLYRDAYGRIFSVFKLLCADPTGPPQSSIVHPVSIVRSQNTNAGSNSRSMPPTVR